ncbi:hypothetical protein XK97_14705 [Obesumbacterium proteus]|nr:hypothetical protein XK97_14705 [Obesumbacterium proteus]
MWLLDVLSLTLIVSSARIGDMEVIPERVYKSIEYNYMNFEQLVSLPHDGRVVIKCKDGSVSSMRILNNREHVATVEGFIELMLDAGYRSAIIQLRQPE